MAFGAFNPNRPHQMMSDINVTPMVDVMLVLLVIFIITAPMFTHAVKLELPQASSQASPMEPDTVTIAIDAAGSVYWNKEKVDGAALDPQPELQLHGDKATRYEYVAQVMAAAQAQGLTRIGFVTEPRKEKNHGQR
jgi:biopolymer transport protein ExbD